jgi:hypothetical protein
MWFSPRRTTRALLATEHPPTWIPVYALATVSHILGNVNLWLEVPEAKIPALIRWVTATAIVSIGWLSAGPRVVAFFGRRQGGVGTPEQIRLALAWATLPTAASALLWLPMWIAADGATVTTESPTDTAGDLLALMLLLVSGAFLMWSAALTVAAVAEVQQLSIARALDGLAALLVLAYVGGILCLALLGNLVPD